MIDALYIATSGLRSEQRNIDVISNNVANMQTPGFKKSRANFMEVSSAIANVDGAPTQSTFRSGGTSIGSTSMVFSTGEPRLTRSTFDIAIDGNGFFELEAEGGGLVYTRDGQLRLDDTGFLVTSQGLKVSGGIQIPPDAAEVLIGKNGEVTAKLGDSTERVLIGAIELAAFPSQDALVAIGDNQFAANEATGAPIYGRPGEEGMGQLMQGYIELSNVNVVDEMTSLVLAQRAYQLNARVLQASDQILETINNLRR